MDLFWYIRLYLLTTSLIFGIDFVWLIFIAKKFYAEHLGHLMSSSFNLLPGVAFYLFYSLAIIVFVLNTALKEGSLTKAIIYGAFLGFICYSTYDLTNQATLRNWPIIITLVDILWGTILTAVVSAICFYIFK